MLKPCLAFDLEVVGNERTDKYIDTYKEFKAPANYKNKEAIDSYIANAKAKEKLRAALHPPTQQIWVACFEVIQTGYKKSFESKNEYDLVNDIFDYLESKHDHVLFGFNSRSYDVPCLFAAALRHNIAVPRQLRHQSYQSDILDDFYHNKIRLMDIAWMLGREKLMDGGDVGQAYIDYMMGNDNAKNQVIKYCIDDTNICAEYVRRVYHNRIPF